EADRESARRRNGHGNAIAQGYNHVILPLCNERDRRTQVRWGVADFRRRFRREPESLWLPETACDDATLETLIEEGLKYVILSPFQAERVRPVSGDSEWRTVSDGSVDTSVPYNYFHRDRSGRSIAVFFYDGHISKAIAFDGLLASSRALVDRFERAAANGASIVSVATDGETYGHHYRFGELCLAHALEVEAEARGFRVTNYGEFLASHPPASEVEIKQGPEGKGTAWSCSHGVGRWSSDCGCHAGTHANWNQKWRAPLRAALDLLRDDAARKFETAGGDLFRDPWAARDAYVELLFDENVSQATEDFLRRHASRTLRPFERERALKLLELQRGAMVMYTSCGWFFDDISGLEAVQVLRYAGHTIELMDELELVPPRAAFLEILAEARSNAARMGNGADVFARADEASRAAARHTASHDLRPKQGEEGKAEKIFESVAEELITKAVRSAVRSPSTDGFAKALAWVELARRLGRDDFLSRAQEIVYEAVGGGPPVSEELRALATALRLAPCLLVTSQDICSGGAEASPSDATLA
ncbi:MAG TPA: DUF3536 domain-containing protein, partial [Pyrinomonadaceae bacterium]|nr:DUF3536 domain-containing protein [Pyrinomonadaceae bacterium]